ncbi:hypothetical protein JBE27_38090 [Streptomyces albiflaviniger]|nr:hypothetical protein [Streptomyces albiflaviniger]
MGEEVLLYVGKVARRRQLLTGQGRHQVQQGPQTADPVGDLVREGEHYGAARLLWDEHGAGQGHRRRGIGRVHGVSSAAVSTGIAPSDTRYKASGAARSTATPSNGCRSWSVAGA